MAANAKAREAIQQHNDDPWYKEYKDKIEKAEKDGLFASSQSAYYDVDPAFRFETQCRNSILTSFCRKGYPIPQNPWDIVGLSMSEFKQHLLSTWRETYGYEWDMIEKAHIDHIIPLKQADTLEDVIRLCHYSNLRLIRATDNLRKGKRIDYAIGLDKQ